MSDIEQWEARERARWETQEAEQLVEDALADEIEWEKVYGAAARHASYRDTVGRL